MKISIAIPCWSMNGEGQNILNKTLLSIASQDFERNEFEIIITDHSEDANIENVCYQYRDSGLDIKYYRNENKRGNPAANTNMGLDKCSGDYIKLLCQDDYFYDNQSLSFCYVRISDSNLKWSFDPYVHTNDRVTYFRYYVPYINDKIGYINTLGTPSALTISRDVTERFDENLFSMYDCEFYHRMNKKYGNPNLCLNGYRATMVNFLHENQTTNTIITEERLEKEKQYVIQKHKDDYK